MGFPRKETMKKRFVFWKLIGHSRKEQGKQDGAVGEIELGCNHYKNLNQFNGEFRSPLLYH